MKAYLNQDPLPDKLKAHPLFSGEHPVGIITAQRPVYKALELGENPALERKMQQMGLGFEPTEGVYNGHEDSYLVHNPTMQQMYQLGKDFGQESVVWSEKGKHHMLYSNGPHEGKFNPFTGKVEHWEEEEGPPENYWSRMPGDGFFRIEFDWDKLHPAPIDIAAIPMSKSEELVEEDPVIPHNHSYPWHETLTTHHPKAFCPGGVAVSTKDLKKAEPNNRTSQSPSIDRESAYYAAAQPYGLVGGKDNLPPHNYHYNERAVDGLLTDMGYKAYSVGKGYGKSDLSNRNYDTNYLQVHVGPDSSWQKMHELAHALTQGEVNKLYGEGKRVGRLGRHRTTREAMRAVHWEWLAAHKQRELSQRIGANVKDADFNKELNTIMHDGVYRVVTGEIPEAEKKGFRPHPHKVPLSMAFSKVREAANNLGLVGQYDLLKKAEKKIVADKNGYMAPEEVRAGVLETLKKTVKTYEDELLQLRKAEGEQLQKGCGAKEKRQIEHIRTSEESAGKSPRRAEEIAHATINKEEKSPSVKMVSCEKCKGPFQASKGTEKGLCIKCRTGKGKEVVAVGKIKKSMGNPGANDTGMDLKAGLTSSGRGSAPDQALGGLAKGNPGLAMAQGSQSMMNSEKEIAKGAMVPGSQPLMMAEMPAKANIFDRIGSSRMGRYRELAGVAPKKANIFDKLKEQHAPKQNIFDKIKQKAPIMGKAELEKRSPLPREIREERAEARKNWKPEVPTEEELKNARAVKARERQQWEDRGTTDYVVGNHAVNKAEILSDKTPGKANIEKPTKDVSYKDTGSGGEPKKEALGKAGMSASAPPAAKPPSGKTPGKMPTPKVGSPKVGAGTPQMGTNPGGVKSEGGSGTNKKIPVVGAAMAPKFK